MAISNQQVVAVLKRNPIGMGCGALCLVLVVFSYFRSDAQQTADSELRDKSAKAERLIENVKNSAQLQDQLDQMKLNVAAITSRLVHASDLATNLQYFYKIEADTGCKLAELRQNNLVPTPKGIKPPTYVPVPYSLTVHGDYPHLVHFLLRLENGSHFCVIRTAAFSPKTPVNQDTPADARSEELALTVNLDLLGVPQ